MLKQSLVVAYATLIRAEKYILSEDDRINELQKSVPNDYIVTVAEYLIK